LLRASVRLRDLIGENVMPLEDELAAASKKHFPSFQQAYGALPMELRTLSLNGADRAEDLLRDLAEVVRGDGSDAIKRLGGPESPLSDSLAWARKVSTAFANGLKATVTTLRALCGALSRLPDTGVPGRLKTAAAAFIVEIEDVLAKEEFFAEASTLTNVQRELELLVANAVLDLEGEQKDVCLSTLSKWQNTSDWADLLADDRENLIANATRLPIEAPRTLSGLQQVLAHAFDLNNRLGELEKSVAVLAAQRRLDRHLDSTVPAEDLPEPVDEMMAVPSVFTTVEQIDALIKQLHQLRVRLASRQSLRIRWKQVDRDVV
jgi:hypothetical protein